MGSHSPLRQARSPLRRHLWLSGRKLPLSRRLAGWLTTG